MRSQLGLLLRWKSRPWRSCPIFPPILKVVQPFFYQLLQTFCLSCLTFYLLLLDLEIDFKLTWCRESLHKVCSFCGLFLEFEALVPRRIGRRRIHVTLTFNLLTSAWQLNYICHGKKLCTNRFELTTSLLCSNRSAQRRKLISCQVSDVELAIVSSFICICSVEVPYWTRLYMCAAVLVYMNSLETGLYKLLV